MNVFTSLAPLTTVCDWVWQNSLAAALLVILVLLVQVVFHRILRPRWRYALWGLVVFRLLLPDGSVQPFQRL